MTNGPQRITRQRVADLLGKSVRSVLRLDHIGALHPVRDDDGHVTYDRDQVESLLRARRISVPTAPAASSPPLAEGALCAQVFRELRDGATPIDVAIKFELTPEMLKTLLTAYAWISGAILVTGPERQRLRAILPGARSAPELLGLIERLVPVHEEFRKFVIPCAKCRKPVRAQLEDWEAAVASGLFKGVRHDSCDDPE